MTSTLGIAPSTSAADQLNSHHSITTTRSSIKTHNSTETSESHVTTSISVSSTQSVAVTGTQQAVYSTSLRTVPLTSSSDLSVGPLDTSFTEMKTASELESLSVTSTPTPEITESNGAVLPSQTKSTLTYSSDALSRSVAPDLKYTADYISTPVYSTKVVAQSSFTKTLHHSTASLGSDLGSSGTHNHWVNPLG